MSTESQKSESPGELAHLLTQDLEAQILWSREGPWNQNLNKQQQITLRHNRHEFHCSLGWWVSSFKVQKDRLCKCLSPKHRDSDSFGVG